MPLDFATFLALAPACAPGVAPPTLLAIAEVESRLDPLAIGINGPAGPFVRARVRSAAEAARRADALIAAGRDIDLGLAQINVRNLARFGLSVADAFDPCRNLAASARILAEGYRRAAPSAGGEQRALRTALSFYNTGDPDRGFRNGYVAKVVARAVSTAGPSARPPSANAAPSPAADWDVFGRVRQARHTFILRPSPGAQP
jgi:type IV secretion system protein VirB1